MEIFNKIKQPESRKLEFKEKFTEKSKMLKTIIAFSNGAGGELIIGISDKEREIIGVKDPLLLEEKISNMIYDSIRPMISPYISIININGKNIIHIQVMNGANKPYFIKSIGIKDSTFIRFGSSTRKASQEIIEEMQREIHGYSYEEEIISSLTFNDLDQNAIKYFLHEINVGHLDKDILTKWRILNKNDGDYFPSVLSIILFGKAELSEYDYFNIRISKFNGTDYNDIVGSKEFTIPLFPKIDEIITFLKSYIKRTSVLNGARRIEKTILPDFAIREVVINAIVHKDYSIKSSIKINVFDDKIEVINPGVLYGNLDIQDLGKGISECRNRKIVKIFRKIGFMEELGSGIRRIINLFSEDNLKPPVFEEQGRYFKAILPQEKYTITLTEKIYNIVWAKRQINMSQLIDDIDLHKNTILYHLNILIKSKKIARKGKGKNTFYVIRTK
jgi:predicted HTH transcriptional regulator